MKGKLSQDECYELAQEINEILSQSLELKEDYNYVLELIYRSILFEMGYKI